MTRQQRLRRKLARGLAKKLQEDEEDYAKLVETGVIDHEHLIAMAESGDFKGILLQMKTGITDLVKETPSVLDQLDIDPLEVLPTPLPEEPAHQTADGPADVTMVDRTIAFSDLEGFTAFTRQRGDVEASAILTDHYEAVDAIAIGRGGMVVKRLGDGHMLSFPQPTAAVLAMLELVEEGAGALALRAGAHHGSVIEMKEDLFGDVVNVAARVTDLADGGEALVTTEIRDRAAAMNQVLFSPTKKRRLEGIDTPVEVCSVQTA